MRLVKVAIVARNKRIQENFKYVDMKLIYKHDLPSLGEVGPVSHDHGA